MKNRRSKLNKYSTTDGDGEVQIHAGQGQQKKIVLPDASVRSIMHKHLVKNNEAWFEKIFYQRFGFLHFKPVPQIKFYKQIKRCEPIETTKERQTAADEMTIS